jgi:hypothetical protein
MYLVVASALVVRVCVVHIPQKGGLQGEKNPGDFAVNAVFCGAWQTAMPATTLAQE